MSQARKNGRLVASRRTHRKSRLGCANCKRRRIKCDEKKPSCTNCVRHAIRCDFTSVSPSNPPSAASPGYALSHSPLPVGSPSSRIDPAATVSGLNMLELELFLNYLNHTAETIVGGPVMHTVWRTTIPQIGFTHHYILELILAMSAFQLSRRQPDRALFLRSVAEQYHDSAIHAVTALLPQLSSDNCDALYIASVFICTLGFARGHTPGDYLIISDKGASDWLVLNRGTRAILELQRDVLFSGRLGAMFSTAGRRLRNAFIEGPIPDISEDARAFRSFLVSMTVTEPNTSTYLHAYDRLIRTLHPTIEAVRAGDQTNLPTFLFSWLYCLDENFILCLQQHQPLALVILAYFAVMVHCSRSYWFMDGWAEHIMTGIVHLLPEDYKHWIRWPAEQINWTI